nr:hypothetical protein [Micromonospora sp. DSM 115978]
MKTSGEPAGDSGVSAGGPPVAQGKDDGPERLATPPNQTDSASEPSHTVVVPPTPGGGKVPGPHAEELDERAARRAERLIAFWFTLSVFGTVGFVVANFVGDKHAQYYTPALGAAMGIALGGLGIGLILWAKRLMPHLQAEQPRHEFTSSEAEIAATEETVAQGFADTGLAKRPLLRRTLLGASTALGGLAVVPLLNLTNAKPGKQLDKT